MASAYLIMIFFAIFRTVFRIGLDSAASANLFARFGISERITDRIFPESLQPFFAPADYPVELQKVVSSLANTFLKAYKWSEKMTLQYILSEEEGGNDGQCFRFFG